MRIHAVCLFLTTMLATQFISGSALAQAQRDIRTEMKLEGACARFFGRTRINFETSHHASLPISPLFDDNDYGEPKNKSCTVTLRYTDTRTSQPIAGLSVQIDRVVSVTPDNWNSKTIRRIKTDRNGQARVSLVWDYTTCGVEFFTSATHPITLYTTRGFMQFEQCQEMMFSYGVTIKDYLCK
jgi:hypothetical protein